MKEKQNIHEAVIHIMELLKKQGQAPGTLKNYENSYNVFERYLAEQNITEIDEAVCLGYVSQKTGVTVDIFESVIHNGKVSRRMKPLQLLLTYLGEGKFQYRPRKYRPAFECPVCFQPEYEAFGEELQYRGYSQATIDTNTQKVQNLLEYLASVNISSSEDITILHIEDFLRKYRQYALKYIGLFLYVLRNYFTFMYDRGYITENIALLLPKIRTVRHASIPYAWKKEDIQKLLAAVDRADPKGKRDYAILLIAVRLGLRIGDIRQLKLSSLNWSRKTINLKMSKTGQSIELPLLQDIGWAIIDYLKNGRPETGSDCLFVRHRAPFNAFGDRNSFSRELHRYTVKAGLDIPGGNRHGIHSLRNALAANMLDVKSPLPIISEVLGHQNINTTSIYLKIDIEGLRKCALDPEEVYLR
jgi:site-specific recombinase XerD